MDRGDEEDASEMSNHLIENIALERLINVLDVCELLPDSNASDGAFQNLQNSLVRVRESKEQWLKEKDSLRQLLLFEECIRSARTANEAYSEHIKLQLAAIEGETHSDRIQLNDKDRGKNLEALMGSILAEMKRVYHLQLDYLQEMDNELDRVFDDTGPQKASVFVEQKLSAAFEKLQRVRKEPSFHSSVQTALTILFDLDETQLLFHNSDLSSKYSTCKEASSALEVFPPTTPIRGILTASTAFEAFQVFCKHTTTERSSFTVVTITGDEGTGKSHCLDRMMAYQASSAPHVAIIRPSIPLDFLHSNVGAAENIICSIFDAAVNNKSSAVLLDNADELWSSDDRRHVGSRLGPVLLFVIDSFLQQSLFRHSNVMVVISSKQKASELGIQADTSFTLPLPGVHQRRSLLEDLFHFRAQDNVARGENDQLMGELTDMTVGRSYADLLQCVRQAFAMACNEINQNSECNEATLIWSAMYLLKAKLAKRAPPSLRFGELDNAFEAIVLSGTDLVLSKSDASLFPFLGDSAIAAWKILRRTIYVPFCNYEDYQRLCGMGLISHGTLQGGALLSGLSGSGKSSLALYCAKMIARTVPMLTVLFVSCTSLIHKEVGSSERSIRRLFETARKACPCVIILEGIENIGAKRGMDSTSEGTLDRVLSTLLVELDGAYSVKSSSSDGRLAIIATTIEESWVDAALKRPGRLGSAILLYKDWL